MKIKRKVKGNKNKWKSLQVLAEIVSLTLSEYQRNNFQFGKAKANGTVSRMVEINF